MAATILLTGCQAPRTATEVSSWQLAVVEPIQLVNLARVRVSRDRPLPNRLVQTLCPEYSLVLVRRQSDWAEMCRRLDLPLRARNIDLNDGPVVGLLAHIGQNAEDKWPVRLTSARLHEGDGLLEAALLPGFYYPVSTAGYLELAQLRGISSVGAVRVNARSFLIRLRL